MQKIKDIQKKYCSQAMIITIVLSILCIILGQKALGKGLILGTLFSVVNFIIMGKLIPMKMAKSRSKASTMAFFSLFLRLLIMAVPLIMSIKMDSVNFLGVVIGLFMVQLTMLFNHIILNRLSLKHRT